MSISEMAYSFFHTGQARPDSLPNRGPTSNSRRTTFGYVRGGDKLSQSLEEEKAFDRVEDE